jgi:hypothetical protein
MSDKAEERRSAKTFTKLLHVSRAKLEVVGCCAPTYVRGRIPAAVSFASMSAWRIATRKQVNWLEGFASPQ